MEPHCDCNGDFHIHSRPRSFIGTFGYVAGSLGTLIGADLVILDKVAGLDAPAASIGSASTFDGIFFLTGIAAVLLGSVASPGEQ